MISSIVIVSLASQCGKLHYGLALLSLDSIAISPSTECSLITLWSSVLANWTWALLSLLESVRFVQTGPANWIAKLEPVVPKFLMESDVDPLAR